MRIPYSEQHYNVLKKNTVLFLKLTHEYGYDKNGEQYNTYEWKSVDKDLGISLEAGNFGDRSLGYCLIIVDTYHNGGRKEDGNSLEFHRANEEDRNDWLHIINSLVVRSQVPEDKYAFMYLLWFLDKTNWSAMVLKDALRQYSEQEISFLVARFNEFGRCLSMNKQKRLLEVFESLGQRYSVYHQKQIHEAYEKLYPNAQDANSLNMFELIDRVINAKVSLENFYNNQYLQLYRWLQTTNSPLDDYALLKNLFPIVSEPTRLDIVKRYFHDIRNGLTNFDLALLLQFKDNKYDEFIRYRYSVETPAEHVVLTVPLLCDSIITLYKSKGQTFQSFEGLLDFVVTHCDKVHPNVDFKMERFLPICNCGAVYNKYFKGFIDYSLVRKPDETLLSEKNIREVIRYILDLKGKRETYYVCKFDDGKKLSSETVQHCLSLRRNNHIKDCLVEKQYDNIWLVKNEYKEILKTFIPSDKIIVNTNGQICVTLEMTSEQCLRDYVRNLINNKFTNGELVVPSYSKKGKTYNLFLIEQFTQILRMRLFPQEGALVGTKFDVFGIWKAIKSQYSPIQFEYKSFSDEKHTEYKNSEVAEVKKRTIASLKKELGVEITSKGYFEIPYNREKLAKILSKYYFKESFKKENKDYHHEFLTSSPSKLMKYCAPQKSQENNIAIDLPYFWCRGKECFHNNLENQMLAECDDWHKYSLYHLAEIIGYPKLHITDAGYEPDAIVRNFIAIANKVVQKFHSLKCRNCGHLMFTDKANGFNRYNWFACVNPTCENFRASVYINFCYNCKKGLIDSRDTAKCSNGWYICPTCLSCCDDEQYERLAQRYILSNRPIPDRIKEKLRCGHNDKSIYFCPKCGTKLEEIVEHDETYRGCPNCHQKFNIMK